MNRRTQRIGTMVASLMLAVTGLTALSGPARASTDPGGKGGTTGYHEAGCKGEASLWLAPQHKDVSWWHTMGMDAYKVHMRIVTQTAYALCTLGRDRIKPKWSESCYTWIYGKNVDTIMRFNGVTVNPYIWSTDDGHSVNQGAYKIKDDQTVQNCRRADIPTDREAWLYRFEQGTTNATLRRKTHVRVHLFLQSDPEFTDGNYRFKPGKGPGDRDLRLK